MASLVQRYIGNQHTLVNTCISARSILFAHKCAVVNTLLQRADKLCDQESERKEEIATSSDQLNKTVTQTGCSVERNLQKQQRTKNMKQEG